MHVRYILLIINSLVFIICIILQDWNWILPQLQKSNVRCILKVNIVVQYYAYRVIWNPFFSIKKNIFLNAQLHNLTEILMDLESSINGFEMPANNQGITKPGRSAEFSAANVYPWPWYIDSKNTQQLILSLPLLKFHIWAFSNSSCKLWY